MLDQLDLKLSVFQNSQVETQKICATSMDKFPFYCIVGQIYRNHRHDLYYVKSNCVTIVMKTMESVIYLILQLFFI